MTIISFDTGSQLLILGLATNSAEVLVFTSYNTGRLFTTVVGHNSVQSDLKNLKNMGKSIAYLKFKDLGRICLERLPLKAVNQDFHG